MLTIFNLWDPLSKLVSFKTLPQKSHVPFDVPASEHIGNNMPQWFWQSLPRASGILWHLVLTTWINIEVLQAVFAPLISYATDLLFLVSPFKSMHPGPASGKPVSTLSSVSCSKKALERPIETQVDGGKEKRCHEDSEALIRPVCWTPKRLKFWKSSLILDTNKMEEWKWIKWVESTRV